MALKRVTDLSDAGALVGDEYFEISQVSTTVTITATTISAQASDNSYNDSGSGFVTAGFAVGDRVRVTGFTGDTANNILVGTITALTAAKMTIGGSEGDVIVDDAAGESVTISKWTSRKITSLGIQGSTPAIAVSASRDLAITDVGAILDVDASSGAVTLTIQTNATIAIPVGAILNVFALDITNTITIDAVTGVNLNGSDGASVTMGVQYTEVSLRQRAANDWVIIGTYT